MGPVAVTTFLFDNPEAIKGCKKEAFLHSRQQQQNTCS